MTETPQDLERQIEETRARLSETVDQISDRLDMKAKARAKVQEHVAAAKQDPTPYAAAGAGAVVVLALLVWWRRRD